MNLTDAGVDITVPPRYSGPVGHANGGWIGGVLARRAGHAVTEVTLRRPIPVDRPLAFDGTRLTHDGTLLAEVQAGVVAGRTPLAVTEEVARQAEERSLVRESAEYGSCFVCGTQREDGLRLRPGPLADRPGEVACTVRHEESDEIAATWAALDCPGVWTMDAVLEPMLLGRMTVALLRPMPAGQTCVVVGRLEGRQGRKAFTSTAVYLDGHLLARASAIWIAVRRPGGE